MSWLSARTVAMTNSTYRSPINSLSRVLGYAWFLLAGAVLLPSPALAQPPQNPPTEEKRILGKILFFEEQLSSTNTVACATCHSFKIGGVDPRRARNPGLDGALNTPDDIFGSFGVISSDASRNYVRDPVFGTGTQITSRSANSPISTGGYRTLFWDGRAPDEFRDPETGEIAGDYFGMWESQAVVPPLNAVEMGHTGINWSELKAKLARVNPLDLAIALPPDVADALTGKPSYPELFRRAFGDDVISARRIAYAIATYERTLDANQTPWDALDQGNPNALTPNQLAGLTIFTNNCNLCHPPPFFTNSTFRNIGLRPPAEDRGRQNVTGLNSDRGKFKTPGLRSAGIKTSFMHNGMFSTLQQVVDFYARTPGAPQQFTDNRDPLMTQINITQAQVPLLMDFLANALTDPRVAAGIFPFDHATLFTDETRAADHPSNLEGGVPGTGGVIPAIILPEPAMIGNLDFRIGLDRALPNAAATLGISTTPPVNGQVTPTSFVGAVTATGSAPGLGLATLHWPLAPGIVTGGQVLYMQWFIADPGAAGGVALSQVYRVPVFCGSYGCPTVPCYANCDNSTLAPTLTANDFQCFLNKFAGGDAAANCDGSTAAPVLTANDFQCFLNAFAAGCP